MALSTRGVGYKHRGETMCTMVTWYRSCVNTVNALYSLCLGVAASRWATSRCNVNTIARG